jgi:hypothetical protein
VKAARCDTTTHLCAYDVCPVTACQSAACDTSSFACSVPSTLGFHASSFRVNAGGVGCGNAASRCIAAAYPFVFVGSTNGVVAYDLLDARDTSPPLVPVSGLPFLPTRIVQSGRRIWFIGSVVGSGPTYHLALAWLDVPQNPFVKTLAATTAFVAYPQSWIPDAFPTTGGAIFLVHPDSGKAWPAVIVNAPVPDSSSIDLSPSPGIAQGARVVGASGARLVTHRFDSPPDFAIFSFENDAGTSSAQPGGESVASAMGTVYPQDSFAFGPEGSVLWAAPASHVPDGGQWDEYAARMTWLVNDDKSGFAQASKVDVETYAPPVGYGMSLAGPIAWIDKNDALVVTAAKEDPPSQSAVQVAQRAMMPASVLPGRRYVLPVSISATGAAASGKLAFVLTSDDPTNQSATVHVFAPGCD